MFVICAANPHHHNLCATHHIIEIQNSLNDKKKRIEVLEKTIGPDELFPKLTCNQPKESFKKK